MSLVRRFLFSCIFLFSFSLIYSQENLNISELESLIIKNAKEGNYLELARYQTQLGFLYKQTGKIDKSTENYAAAIKSSESLGNLNAVKNLCKNIGINYSETGNYDQALIFFKKSFKISESQGKKPEIVSGLINIALVLQNLKNYQESNQNLEKAVSIALELNDKVSLKNCYTTLAENYEKLGNSAKSKENFEIATSIKNHIQKEELNKFEYRTKQAETEVSQKNVEIQTKENEIQQISREKQLTLELLNKQKELTKLRESEFQSKEKLQKAKQKNIFNIIAFLVFIVLMGFVLLLFILKQLSAKKKANALLEKSNKQITEQKKEIECQRDILTIQKKKITDSIMSAQRIQNAVLPPVSIIEKAFPEHFIIFRPRDIVSGDFYWMTEKEGFFIIAAVDCTGHGVPGAFMSMLGLAFLNDIINKAAFNKHFRSLSAKEILNQLREHVILSLHQSGELSENKEGMDISLTIIDIEGMQMQFAGAHHPVYIIRNNELTKIAGDPMPIGVYKTSGESFKNQEFELEENDLIYLFTDGYYDQFGGEKGTKMFSATFRQYLLEIHQQPMAEQKKLLETFFDNWRGKRDQMDDVTVIGFKFQPSYKISNTPQYKLWRDKRILIAEDIDINFLLLVEALRPTKAKIFRVENGLEAVEYCKNNELDLIFMDIHMPLMNGIEATKLIKQVKPDLPIIAQTAVANKEEIEAIMEAGCCDFISKPINLKTFISTVRKHLIK